jgi:hypothetical protein
VFTSVFVLIQMILSLYFIHAWLCVNLVFALLLDIWWSLKSKVEKVLIIVGLTLGHRAKLSENPLFEQKQHKFAYILPELQNMITAIDLKVVPYSRSVEHSQQLKAIQTNVFWIDSSRSCIPSCHLYSFFNNFFSSVFPCRYVPVWKHKDIL